MKLTQQLSALTKTVLLTGALCTSPLSIAADTDATPGTSIPLEEIRLFTEVFERIKNAYVEPVDDAKLLEMELAGGGQ